MASVITTQLCHWSMKAAIDNMQMSEPGCVPGDNHPTGLELGGFQGSKTFGAKLGQSGQMGMVVGSNKTY